jgi:hypothetical protein
LKKIIAISLLISYQMATTELYQLLKLPILIEHFMEHQEQNKNITLIEFLCLHYANGDVRDADYEKDMKLPFKTHSNNCSANIIAVVANATIKINFPVKSNFAELRVLIFSKEIAFSSLYLSNIWQPPRFC